VIRRDGEVGQFLPINQPLFWVSCLSPLRITADVDEEDIALVHVGQQVLVRADAFPGRVFHAHVRALTPKGDPVARSYRIRIVPDDTTPLQIGMTAEVNIITAEKQRALLVPSSAVTNNAVWILDRGKLQKRAVHVGIRGTDRFEIVAGLTVHDQIVETPPANAREGMRAVPVARRP
jgi:RND family efflux transporter MFP subunit